jgi:hypothetical protein
MAGVVLVNQGRVRAARAAAASPAAVGKP